jgi:diguanylate cyclase (GGDEF)-like protein
MLLFRCLERQSKGAIFLISLVITGLLSIGDYLTGPEISFSIFYVLPIAIAAWFGSRTVGFLIAVVAAATLNIVEMMSGVVYSHPLIVYWNSIASFGTVLLLAYLISDIRERLHKEREIADTDSLTGSYSRRRFYRHVEDEIQRASRYGHPFTIAYIDLDNFKTINDSHGHPVGDDLLRTVGRVMTEHARETDITARLGGDEFAILFVETGLDEATNAFGKIHTQLLAAMRQSGWPVTFSIGMVTYETAPADVRQVLKQADETMYAAKRSGKDRVFHIAFHADVMVDHGFRRNAG